MHKLPLILNTILWICKQEARTVLKMLTESSTTFHHLANAKASP